MDLNGDVQETDNADDFGAGQEWEEFQCLVHLSSEFSVLDRSLFPFSVLHNSDLRGEVYGFPHNPMNSKRLVVRGNYVAGYILRDLRIQRQKNIPVYPELSFIVNLPPDLVFEIFEHLHPIDLYNMIRTSKGFRNLLLRRQATGVWSEAFRRHPDIPPCPPDLSLPRWASLLFGPSTCDDCGAAEAMPDFSFQNRKCDHCMTTTLLHSGSFQHLKDELTSQGDILLTLVRRTHRYDAISHVSDSNLYEPRYSAHEVNSRAAEMKQFLADINSNQPNAQGAYDTFKTETAATVDTIMKRVQVCNDWYLTIYKLLNNEILKRVPYICGRFEERLVKMGHNRKDVEVARGSIYWSIYYRNARKFNGKVFHSLLPSLEVYLRHSKCGRLASERDDLIAGRRKEVKAIYQGCQRLMDPALWQYLPGADRSYTIDIIFDYICSSEKSALLAADEAAQKIRLFFDHWLAYGKRALLELMSKHHTATYVQDGALDLATSVFICPLHSPERNNAKCHSVLLGWEDAAVHLDCNISESLRQLTKNSPELTTFEYSMNGRETALYLLGLLGLEASTLASDVGALEARFMCTSCPLEVKGRTRGHFALKFKECISHAVSQLDHPTGSFSLLSKEITKSIVFHESCSSPRSERSWCCRHCSSQFESYVSRNDVIGHIQKLKVHSILNPVEEVDFIYQRQKTLHPRKPYFVGIDNLGTYRCKNCPTLRSPRLWQLLPLLAHLKDSHQVSEAVENVHWYEVDLWEG